MKRLFRSGVSGAQPQHCLPGATGTLRRALATALIALPALGLASGGSTSASTRSASTASGSNKVLYLGAIPDQDQDQLQQIYGTMASYLTKKLGVTVEYRPVSDYAAAVSQYRLGDLGLVWFGGLTGVQAYLQVPGSVNIAQRNIDGSFHSLFIVNSSTRLKPVHSAAGLAELKGTRFTFGSNSSTSGYLMPAYWLLKGGVNPAQSFTGEPGFSGSHDKTIDLVQSGTYQAGAVNEQVWASRVKAHTVDTKKVRVIWRTPAFHDYHWVLSPTATKEFGPGFAAKVKKAFYGVSAKTAIGRKILNLFGCTSFVPTKETNYAQVESVGKQLGLIAS